MIHVFYDIRTPCAKITNQSSKEISEKALRGAELLDVTGRHGTSPCKIINHFSEMNNFSRSTQEKVKKYRYYFIELEINGDIRTKSISRNMGFTLVLVNGSSITIVFLF